MPRSKREIEIGKAIKKGKETRQDIAIEERLAGCGRKSPQDIIYVGDVVERTLKGEFGAIIKALTAGRISVELNSQRKDVSSDRVLGRLEMADGLWTDLEQFVLDKDALLKPQIKDLEGVESFNYSPD